jgi:Arc/MetJ-type ribon-helix-helix transcriptional regulator
MVTMLRARFHLQVGSRLHWRQCADQRQSCAGYVSASVALVRIPEYACGMRRITISLDEDLARLAEAEVRAGRADSVSAWVADAIRAKARARADLIADLEELEQRDPTPPELIASMARALGVPRTVVAKALKSRQPRSRGRRAA